MDASTAALGSTHPRQRFAAFASGLLVYLLVVIAFGAWVRITGSGAGCGDHWPTCHGQIVPRSPSAATLIEYTHRMTSGFLGLLSLALPFWAWRIFPAGHPARRASLATLLFVIGEAAIGAGLVLRGLVAADASVARAITVGLHLANTLLLTRSAALTVAWARVPDALPPRRRRDAVMTALSIALVVVSATGAVTALGDTLFPVGGAEAATNAQHFLVQLRVVHPVLACAAVVFALSCAYGFAEQRGARPWAFALGGSAIAELVIGALNIALGAPGALQIVHLLLAQLTWLSAVILGWHRARPSGAPATL